MARMALYVVLKEKDAEAEKLMGRMSGIGTNFAVYVVSGLLIGWLIQKYWKPDWAPWALLTGLLFGLVGGTYRFIKDANAAEKK